MMTPGPLPRSLRERLTAINSTSRVSILFTARFTAVKAVTTCRAWLTLSVESLQAVAIAVGAQVRLRNKPQTHAPAAASDGRHQRGEQAEDGVVLPLADRGDALHLPPGFDRGDEPVGEVRDDH